MIVRYIKYFFFLILPSIKIATFWNGSCQNKTSVKEVDVPFYSMQEKLNYVLLEIQKSDLRKVPS